MTIILGDAAKAAGRSQRGEFEQDATIRILKSHATGRFPSRISWRAPRRSI
ncbi:hypothetical protein MES5069_1190018 [Mesorhizobium escarrei]|uniref:Uncharacterized protein n=1 Tax=Mesorhizobium escarrei TaxID=666018 RepID=A0ABN8JD48_9HYPH|nr:hypothetical protein MES5069_1190018 [Mesorhizobium escarrei]